MNSSSNRKWTPDKENELKLKQEVALPDKKNELKLKQAVALPDKENELMKNKSTITKTTFSRAAPLSGRLHQAD